MDGQLWRYCPWLWRSSLRGRKRTGCSPSLSAGRARNPRGVDEGAGGVVPVAVVEDAGDHKDLLGTRLMHVDALPASVRVHLQHMGLSPIVPGPQRAQP